MKELTVSWSVQRKTRDRASWLFMSLAWLALSGLKFVPLLISKLRPPPLAATAGVAEAMLAIAVVVPAIRVAALKASVAIAALLLLANVLPIDGLRTAASGCKCLGPWVNADETTKRATASILLVASVYALRRNVDGPVQ